MTRGRLIRLVLGVSALVIAGLAVAVGMTATRESGPDNVSLSDESRGALAAVECPPEVISDPAVVCFEGSVLSPAFCEDPTWIRYVPEGEEEGVDIVACHAMELYHPFCDEEVEACSIPIFPRDPLEGFCEGGPFPVPVYGLHDEQRMREELCDN